VTDHVLNPEKALAADSNPSPNASPAEAAGAGALEGPDADEKGAPSPPASTVAIKGAAPHREEEEPHEASDPDATLTRPSPVMHEDVVRICREVLAPLVRADGGEMHLVVGNSEEIQIHLSGTCAGCPGAALTRDRILAPILVAVMPKARLTVTTGVRVPEGAVRVEAP
jgi:Fe-S cluster biogenesis protein NfuA